MRILIVVLFSFFLLLTSFSVASAQGLEIDSAGFRVEPGSGTLEVLTIMKDGSGLDSAMFRVNVCGYTGTICHIAVPQVDKKGTVSTVGITDGYTFWKGEGIQGRIDDEYLHNWSVLELPRETGKYKVHIVVFEDAEENNSPWGDLDFEGDIYVGPEYKTVGLVPEESMFRDVLLDTQVGRAAVELYYRGVVSGYDDGTFRPNQSVNRAEAMKMLTLANMGEAREWLFEQLFLDIVEGQWYTPFVVAAAKSGIVQGYEDGHFHPGNTINTAEFLKMFAKTFYGENQAEITQTRFSDVPAGAWYAPYVYLTEEIDPFPQRTMLDPGREITRGDVAVALLQKWEYVNNSQ